MPAAGTRGVIWDLDGVIIDSGEQHWQAWKALAAETHVTFTEADFRRTFGQRNSDIIPPYWHTHDPDEIKRLADHKESIYREMLKKDARALPGAMGLIRALHEAGWKQALGSSAPLENIQLILDLLDLRLLLDAVVSGEEAPRGKPAPDIFLEAARRLNVPSCDCVVIEDSLPGCQAAIDAGMAVIVCPSPMTTHLDFPVAAHRVSSLADVCVGDVESLL